MVDNTKPDEALKSAITRHLLTISQARLARESGLNGSAISTWINGKYKGDNAALESKLSAWIASQAQSADVSMRAKPDNAGWVETPTSKRIERAFVLARSLPSMAVVYGAPGVGKTSTIKHYARTTPNVWTVTASPAVSSMAAILRLIGVAVNARGGRRNYDLASDIANRVRGTRGLLVVDEFQHLALPALEQIRAIHDDAEIGVAFVGNESGYAQMTGGPRRLDHAQLSSRCSSVVRLYSPKAEDVSAILDAWHITSKAVKDFALQISATAGGLRVLVKMLEQAALFVPEGETFDLVAMRAAFAEIGGTE